MVALLLAGLMPASADTTAPQHGDEDTDLKYGTEPNLADGNIAQVEAGEERRTWKGWWTEGPAWHGAWMRTVGFCITAWGGNRNGSGHWRSNDVQGGSGHGRCAQRCAVIVPMGVERAAEMDGGGDGGVTGEKKIWRCKRANGRRMRWPRRSLPESNGEIETYRPAEVRAAIVDDSDLSGASESVARGGGKARTTPDPAKDQRVEVILEGGWRLLDLKGGGPRRIPGAGVWNWLEGGEAFRQEEEAELRRIQQQRRGGSNDGAPSMIDRRVHRREDGATADADGEDADKDEYNDQLVIEAWGAKWAHAETEAHGQRGEPARGGARRQWPPTIIGYCSGQRIRVCTSRWRDARADEVTTCACGKTMCAQCQAAGCRRCESNGDGGGIGGIGNEASEEDTAPRAPREPADQGGHRDGATIGETDGAWEPRLGGDGRASDVVQHGQGRRHR